MSAFDFRYIYMGKTSANRRYRKFGLSGNVPVRWQHIDRSRVTTREWWTCYYRVLFAERFEQWLLNRYRDRKVYLSGSGGTEWRDLGFLRATEAKLLIVAYWAACWLAMAIAFALGAVLVYGFVITQV